MTQGSEPQEGTTRRAAIAGAGLAGLAAALTACGASGVSESGSAQGSSSSGGSGGALTSTSEIPVGGGKVFSAEKMVVTQPAAGKFRAFSAVCTHKQCLVDQVANGTIDCPCHGSEFSVKNSSVVSGPAPSPLPEKPITVAGGKITLA